MAERVSHGVAPTGLEATAPSPYSEPTPVEQFRWTRSPNDSFGYMKWDKALDEELSGGKYVIQYSDSSNPTSDSNWTALTEVSHDSVSGIECQYQDPAGTANRKYRIKKVTSVARGGVSSIWVGVDVEYEANTARCYVMIYIKDLNLNVDDSFQLEAKFNGLQSTEKTVKYKNKSVIPIMTISKKIEAYSGLLIIPLIPSALITDSSNNAVDYDLTIKGRGGISYTWENVTVPTQASVYLRDLI
uniref:Uncharacterized protein n=1 Tax=viral metagenome TaxID=1070528 RepID=A0A6H1ZIN5_9ZZZZ